MAVRVRSLAAVEGGKARCDSAAGAALGCPIPCSYPCLQRLFEKVNVGEAQGLFRYSFPADQHGDALASNTLSSSLPMLGN